MDPQPSREPADDGFTLAELLIAISVVTIVMTSLGSFFTATVTRTTAQGDAQSASRLVTDALERVRAVRGSALPTGRDQTSVLTQWGAADSAIKPLLQSMLPVWDPGAAAPQSPVGGLAAIVDSAVALPTEARIVAIDGVDYTQNFYLGQCWQPAVGGDCAGVKFPGAVGYYRAIVEVAWTDRTCAGSRCTRVAATLVSSAATDPVFVSGQTAVPPKVVNPGPQTGERTVPFSVTLTATGGAPALIWGAAGLPPGLTMSSAGVIAGTPTTPGSFSVTVTVTDAFKLTGSAAFTITINELPAVVKPNPQSTQGGVPITPLAVTATDGTAPFRWSATGLPPGLTIDAVTGVVSGTPTTVVANGSTVKVTITDAFAKTSSATFLWVVPSLAFPTPAKQNSSTGYPAADLPMQATGGIKPYAFTAVSLPPGLVIDAATGTISGTPTATGTYKPTVTVTDAAGTVKSVSFNWTVGPYLTAPANSATVLSGTVGTALTYTGTAVGGATPYTWSAANLPDGLTLDAAAGTITGTPTAAGRFLTTIGVAAAAPNTTSTARVRVAYSINGGTGLRITNAATSRTGTVGTALTVTMTAAGNTGPLAWSATGLPAGLSLNGGTGVISGKPTAAGTWTTTVTVTDGTTKKVSRWMFDWTVT